MPLGRLDPSKLLPWLDPTELINDVMDGRDTSDDTRKPTTSHCMSAYAARVPLRCPLWSATPPPSSHSRRLRCDNRCRALKPRIRIGCLPFTHGCSRTRIYFSLETVLDLALTHNPTVASAEGTIEQNRGQQVAANTYLNPSISANSGRGNMRDLGTFDPGGENQSPSST